MSGRKRHILVDTTGLPPQVVVHPADVQDRDGAKLWVDAAYQGPCATWIAEPLGWAVAVVPKPPTRIWWPADQAPPAMPTGFQVLPRRWVVERTFAWLGRYRRLSKDYEVLTAPAEGWIYLAMTRLMVARLAR